jgi:hypothetical protein
MRWRLSGLSNEGFMLNDSARERFSSRLSGLMRAGLVAAPALLGATVLPTAANACACGCAVFDVGTSSLLPSCPGGTAFVEYNFLDQDQNWSGTSSAPAANNGDKEIRSNFITVGGQYMFNSSWGVMVELPYTDRYFRTQVDPTTIGAFEHSSIGDIRLMGVYSGFSSDMSTGIVFGVKLPTGDHTYPNFDADTEIGSGSTDLLLGAYHSGTLTSDGSFGYYAQVLWQHEVATQDAYSPGPELNGALGVSYNNWSIGDVHVAPIFQMIYSQRGRDSGANADPLDSGYSRVLASPGVEFDSGNWKFYTDVELPLYLDMNGNQLIAHWSLKTILSYSLAN